MSLFTINDAHSHSMSNLSELEQRLTIRVKNLENELSEISRLYFQLKNQNDDLKKTITSKEDSIKHLNLQNENQNAEIHRLGRVEVQLRLEITNLKRLIPTQPQNGGRNWF